jgi:hypothetical protein
MSSMTSPQAPKDASKGGTETSKVVPPSAPPHVATEPIVVHWVSHSTRFPHARPFAEHVATPPPRQEVVPGVQSCFWQEPLMQDSPPSPQSLFLRQLTQEPVAKSQSMPAIVQSLSDAHAERHKLSMHLPLMAQSVSWMQSTQRVRCLSQT